MQTPRRGHRKDEKNQHKNESMTKRSERVKTRIIDALE